jgi:AhpD family alkylhydroperoxidase
LRGVIPYDPPDGAAVTDEEIGTMQPRMTHPAMIVPGAMAALQAVGASVRKSGLSPELIELVNLRASQINGCSVCVEMHARDLRKAGESDERLFAVAAWREAPYFDDAERAALALAEAMTRLSDRPESVSDAIWDDAARHFDEPELAALVLAIANINVWNRLNAATRQVAGSV